MTPYTEPFIRGYFTGDSQAWLCIWRPDTQDYDKVPNDTSRYPVTLYRRDDEGYDAATARLSELTA